MRSLATLAVFVAFVAVAAAQSAYYFTSNSTTPHFSSSECRLMGTRICDPENILEGNTYELVQLISSIANLGKGCGEGPGYKVGIAVVRSLVGNSPMDAVEQIARRVHAKWQIGTCGEAIIIASAAAPYNVVYVVAESQTGPNFLNSVRNILELSRPYFGHSQKIGLQYVLLQMKNVLLNNKLMGEYYPVQAPVQANRNGAQVVTGSLLLSVVSLIVFSINKLAL